MLARGFFAMIALFVLVVVVSVLVADAQDKAAEMTEIRMDYVQLGLWLAVGNAIGVPIGSAITGFLGRAWRNLTHE